MLNLFERRDMRRTIHALLIWLFILLVLSETSQSASYNKMKISESSGPFASNIDDANYDLKTHVNGNGVYVVWSNNSQIFVYDGMETYAVRKGPGAAC
ncbi:MAG: hypothetical protein HZA16_06610 [Nitrospirae bacterium]|nr:hypothetical protein [Nitrospirota bacterium]